MDGPSAADMRLTAAFVLCRVACFAGRPLVAPSMRPTHVAARGLGCEGRWLIPQTRIGQLPSPSIFSSRVSNVGTLRASGSTQDEGWFDGKHTFLLNVYIEDTDCFQVVYNANYAKYCDRARQAAVGLTQLAELESKGMHMQLVHLTNHKLKASAILGSSVKVETWIEAADPSTGLIRWRQEVTDADSGAMLSTAQTLTRFVSKDGSKLPVDKSTLAVKAIEARGLGHWGDSGRSQLLHEGKTCSLLSAKLDFRSGQDGNSHHAEFRVFSGVPMEAGYEKIAAIAQGTLHRIIVISDEGLKGLGRAFTYLAGFPFLAKTKLSVLRTFERNRNVALGGSEGLRRIQEDGVFVVVVGFADVCMDLTQSPALGSTVTHRSSVVLKKAKLDFHQELWIPGALTPFATGQVTCLSINSKTKRLAAPPEWVLQRIDGDDVRMEKR